MRRNLPFLIFAAGVLAVLLSLGNWQVRRMHEKAAYLAQIDARITATPAPLPTAPAASEHQFLPVALEGQFTGPEIHVLVSTRDRGAGYRILQAFETDARKVIVDRGYIRLEAKDSPRQALKATVVGNLHWPDERDSYTPENDLSKNIWFARDVSLLAQTLGTEPVLIVLSKSTPNEPTILPLPIDTSSIPNRHLEYVLTWYGLALTWVVMTLYFLRRRSRQDKG